MATIDTGTKEADQALVDHLMAAVKAQEHGLGLDAYEVQGPAQAQILTKDRKYRTQPINHGQEIIFKGVRPGARSSLIFEFTPVDDQPYEQIEWGESKVFDFVENFEDKIVLAMGGPAGSTFKDARRGFARRAREMVEARERKLAEVRVAAEKNAEAIYEANPNYGIF